MHDDYMNTEETAAFLKVSKSLVENGAEKVCFFPTLSVTTKEGAAKLTTTAENGYCNSLPFSRKKTMVTGR